MTYLPTGPEVLSGTEVAGVLSKVLGRTITFHPITFEEQKQAMLDVGLAEAVADDNARAVALMADGDCDYLTDDVPSILGRPARSFDRPRARCPGADAAQVASVARCPSWLRGG